MLEVLKDEAGSPQMSALHDVNDFYYVWMVEKFEEVVLTFDFGGLDGHQHFDDYFFLGVGVFALEDVGVSASADFMRYCVILLLAE